MKILLTILLVACAAQFWAFQEEPAYEQGRAAFKIADTYKWILCMGATSTGIGELDDLLRRLDIQYVRPRFATNPKLTSSVDLTTILEVGFTRLREPLGICNALDRLECVEWAEPIYIEHVLEVPNDYFFPFMRYMDALQTQQAWEIHKGENGTEEVVVAIIDTGTNWKHPDLVGNIWNNLGEDANSNGYTIYRNGTAWVYDSGDLNGIDDDGNGKADDLIGWDFMRDLNGTEYYDPYDAGGHGTNVSGVANARTNNSAGVASVAWNVKTMSISASPNNDNIFRGYEGIIYAAENGAHVINCSWGGIYPSQANQAAINYAWSLGSVIVAASGNSGNQIPLYPASYEKVLAVGIVNNAGVHSVASYGPYLDVCAPSDSNYTTMGGGYGYAVFATSYASPIASSLAALIRSQHPDWSNSRVVLQMQACCENIDSANPVTKHTLLGYGRLNAFGAVSDSTLTPPPGLKLAIQDLGSQTDANSNLAVEPGETFSFNFKLRNSSSFSSSTALLLTLSTTDPDVTILDNSYSASIGADSTLAVNDAFLVQVSPGCQLKYVTFTITCSADIPIITGITHRHDVLVNAPGIFVWEGHAGGRNQSGTYIMTQLSSLGYATALGAEYTINTNVYPNSFHGIDAVFLSFGIVGGYIYRFWSNKMFDALRNYLEEGGRVYIEGGDVVGYDIAENYPEVELGLDGDDILFPLLGLQSATDGATNPITLLSGDSGWHTLGMSFTSSAQTTFKSVDTFMPDANGVEAFIEDGYGCVAVQALGTNGQRTFVMSYALRELVDIVAPNTRAELVRRIAEFFFDGELLLPEVNELLIQTALGDSLQLDWSYPFAVDGFEVLQADSPTDIFQVETETQNTQITLPAQPRKFYKIKANRVFGR